MYHIGKSGKPAICRAKKGNCPLGGTDTHFDSKEACQEHINKQAEGNFSATGGVKADNTKVSERRSWDTNAYDEIMPNGFPQGYGWLSDDEVTRVLWLQRCEDYSDYMVNKHIPDYSKRSFAQNNETLYRNKKTPWGEAEHIRNVAPGIDIVDTCSHGGIKLSAERNRLIPAPLRRKGGWYEEDVDSGIVGMYYRGEMSKIGYSGKRCFDSLTCYYPDDLEEVTGEELPGWLNESTAMNKYLKDNPGAIITEQCYNSKKGSFENGETFFGNVLDKDGKRVRKYFEVTDANKVNFTDKLPQKQSSVKHRAFMSSEGLREKVRDKSSAFEAPKEVSLYGRLANIPKYAEKDLGFSGKISFNELCKQGYLASINKDDGTVFLKDRYGRPYHIGYSINEEDYKALSKFLPDDKDVRGR